MLQQSFWSFGTFFNALLAWLVLETLDWRWYLILSSLPLVLTVYLAWQLPESCAYLVNIGKHEKAEQILQKAARINKSTSIQYPERLKLAPQQIIYDESGDPREIFNEQYVTTTITLAVLMFVITFSYYGISFLSERFFDQLATNNDQDDTEKYWKIAVTTSSEIPVKFIFYYRIS